MTPRLGHWVFAACSKMTTPSATASRTTRIYFHAAALRVGGSDNGAPGLRPDYGDHYYAAFLVDPDGHRIEAVINKNENSAS
jgi:hypothetical protein